MLGRIKHLKQIKKDYKNQNKNSFNEDDIYFGKNPDNYYTSDNNESEYCYQPENDTASDIWPYNMKKQFLIQSFNIRFFTRPI